MKETQERETVQRAIRDIRSTILYLGQRSEYEVGMLMCNHFSIHCWK